ncbi:glutamyl-tRNA reductase [Fusobacterium sp.]|uniref:glutamyl-tRNA reductase n=1 Tax=Fusobacterium sp. TaxID=68766 RepID=UPI0028FDDA9F|nr:glutamyl-tRNA reductase [Fusobacterium sp.]MDU1912404.1 glutamyl-tRNA reductase [Fusobacterium sp.]
MNLDKLVVFGISHKELSMSEREEFIKQNPEQIINSFLSSKKIKGYINLSTCLRVEFYLQVAENFSLKDFLECFSFKKGIFTKIGEDAAEYLFKVSCGFYSVIKGEDQILAQIKKAHSFSMENNISSKILNIVFNKAIELGKKFRTESKVCHNALSLEAISLKFIKESIGFLSDKKVLILGVGDLAQAILYLLVKENVKNITITNRTHHKALEVQSIFDIDVISFEHKNTAAAESDVIISATSAPHLVLKSEEIVPYLHNDKKYTFLDLAVPRDIEETIGSSGNVSLFNLDDIWSVYNKNLETRDSLMSGYSYLIDKQMINLKKWFQYYEERTI